MIAQESLDRIKQATNLVELISETVPLKRSGAHYSGLCPFHNERSPSFHVKDGGSFYHCFGCGASGSAVTFVMESRGFTFPEAVDFLASRAGIEVKHEGGSVRRNPAEQQTLYWELNNAAQQYYRSNLKSLDPETAAYFAKRGLSQETIEKFGIGFAPAGWRGLAPNLEKISKNPEVLVKSGLMRRSAKGDLYDTFRGRIMFPVFIDTKRIAGFGGRTIPHLEPNSDATAPKYLNSPETPVYQKSKILYGLPQAMETIRATKELFLVEGYMDVVSLSQAGVLNVVATCGTAVTEEHIKRIAQIANRVTVLFDGDRAGKAAAGKAFSVFMNSGVDVHALFIPDELDPDDVAKREGSGTAEYLKQLPRISLLDCFIDLQVQKLGADELSKLGAAVKGKLSEEVAAALAKVENQIERDELIKRAAFRLVVEPETLREMVAGTKPSTISVPTIPADSSIERGTKAIKDLPKVDQELLIIVMALREDVSGSILANAELCSALDSVTISFLEEFHAVLTSEIGATEKKEQTKQLLTGLGESWLKHWKTAFKMAQDPNVDLAHSLTQCLAYLRRERIGRTLEELKSRLLKVESDEERGELNKQMFLLVQRRDELNQEVR